jgi:hypothetical protein
MSVEARVVTEMVRCETYAHERQAMSSRGSPAGHPVTVSIGAAPK